MFNSESITVDLFYGEDKLGSAFTTSTNEFVFKGVLPGLYSLRISDVVSHDCMNVSDWIEGLLG